MYRFGLILLAAGASTRLGQPKQLIIYEGQTLLRRAATAAVATMCDPIVVVLGAHAAKMRSELTGLPVQIVDNANWEQGMASSLQCGLRVLGDDVSGVVVALCDQPFMNSLLVDDLIVSALDRSVSLAASEYGGTLGVPALFRQSLFAELFALTGAEGARKVIARHAAEAARVPFPGGLIDIDTPNDLASLPKIAAY